MRINVDGSGGGGGFIVPMHCFSDDTNTQTLAHTLAVIHCGYGLPIAVCRPACCIHSAAGVAVL